jgi:hypothetical protein
VRIIIGTLSVIVAAKALYSRHQHSCIIRDVGDEPCNSYRLGVSESISSRTLDSLEMD